MIKELKNHDISTILLVAGLLSLAIALIGIFPYPPSNPFYLEATTRIVFGILGSMLSLIVIFPWVKDTYSQSPDENSKRTAEKQTESRNINTKKKSPVMILLILILITGILLNAGLVLKNMGAPKKESEVQPPNIIVMPTENNGSVTNISQESQITFPSAIDKEIERNTTSTSSGSKNSTKSEGMEFVFIPAGTFNMGSPESDADSDSYERPVHEVTIKKDFYLGKYEVTQKQWFEVMGYNPSYSKGNDMPVQNVSWYNVQEFIKKLNEIEHTDKYRLPSEAEWEYACRAGTTTKYFFGDDFLKLTEYAWYSGNTEKLHAIGQKKPNPWGLYDIYGNVGEWVQDTYDPYDIGAMTLTDGSAWDNGISDSGRVKRGGCWYLSTRDCRSAARLYGFADGRYDYSAGFRLVMEV